MKLAVACFVALSGCARQDRSDPRAAASSELSVDARRCASCLHPHALPVLSNVVDVQRALATPNVTIPAGNLEAASTNVTMQVDGCVPGPEAFGRIARRQPGGRTIRVGDVARREVPADVRLDVSRAHSQVVRTGIDTVKEYLFVGAILAAIAVLTLLGSQTTGALVLGGQSLSLLSALLAVPAAYSLYDGATQWIKRRFARTATDRDEQGARELAELLRPDRSAPEEHPGGKSLSHASRPAGGDA
jgi:hypothetical protein